MRTDRDRQGRDVLGLEAADAARPTMRAVVRDTYGSADLLEVQDRRTPSVAGGDVLVAVSAAGLDRGAWHVMTGRPYLMRIAGFGLRRPKNPGSAPIWPVWSRPSDLT